MPSRQAEMLAWIDQQHDRLLEMVRTWAGTSSWSLDPAGIAAMQEAVTRAISPFGPVRRLVASPRTVITNQGQEMTSLVGDVLSLRREGTPGSLRVLLAIHLDTVYPPGLEPPLVDLVENGTILRGPGVADAKGGLAVMLVALEAYEKFGHSKPLTWEVLVNADEELGSPGSAAILAEAATRNDVGLLFEPALDAQGTLAGARKGSGNFTIVVRGRSAHAGRHFAEGRNAVAAAARLATACDRLNAAGRDLTVNVAALHGGEAVNVVPDLAVLRLNIRVSTVADADWATARLTALVADQNQTDGISATLHGSFHCPPKRFDEKARLILDCVQTAAATLGLAITAEPTGGVCDGNKLAAAGLANIDTLGVRGGSIHSPDEYLLVESLTERAKLTAVLLSNLAERGLACS
jgi:glutamate carboxypeptidase